MCSDSFESAVAAALENIPSKTVYLAAVSGGADSVAMLVALAFARESRDFDLRCIHVEHGIRDGAESRGDAVFVRSLCEKLCLPCRVFSVKPGKVVETAGKRGIGIEAAARLYRHRAWSKEASALEAAGRGPVRVLVAHTADDLLETVLMRVLRGVGPSGLAAMPASRGRVLRPLLALGRRDVLSYLAQKGISWREDSTNSDTRYLRNRVRHRLVPLLSDDFPRWRTALSSLAQTQALAADFIVGEANRRIKWTPAPGTSDMPGGFAPKADDVLCTDENGFFAQPAIVREEALFQGIDSLSATPALSCGVKRSNIRHFSRGNVAALDLGQVRLCRNGGTITISRQKKDAGCEYGFSLSVDRPGLYAFKGLTLEVKTDRSGMEVGEDTFFALLPFVLRPAFRKDRIGRAGYGGGEAASAVDSLGIAGFVGMDGRLRGRRGMPQTGENICTVKISRG
ncbi:MAG: tRNA lysidine(34) synthetase TilS [Treponema sp.]|nr:tRNA lysidine(34) synthetase TilS [Treponema sp.]